MTGPAVLLENGQVIDGLGHAPRIALAQRQQLGAQGVAQVFLQQTELLDLGLLKLRQIERQLLACTPCRLAHFLAHIAL